MHRALRLLIGALVAALLVAIGHLASTHRPRRAAGPPAQPVRATYRVLEGAYNESGRRDPRGWILSPLIATGTDDEARFRCVDLHVGTIQPGAMRGNHRHHAKTEVLFTYGAATRWRIEDPGTSGGFVTIEVRRAQQFAAVLPPGVAHAIANVEDEHGERPGHTLYVAGCSDGAFNPAHPATDYSVWPDLRDRDVHANQS